MTAPTKADLQQQVHDLQEQLVDVGQLHETARTLRNVGEWDREAQTISRCVKALDRIADRDAHQFRGAGRDQLARIIQYLAGRYGVPMASPKAVEDLRGDLNDLAGVVRELEQQAHADGHTCGGCA